MNQNVMDTWADDDEIHEQNPFLKFKMVAEKNLITTRSVALDSMHEGLTVNGKKIQWCLLLLLCFMFLTFLV